MNHAKPRGPTTSHERDGVRRVAVVGSGIAGSSCAWALRDRADVTLFEADHRPGGHTATRDLRIGGRSIAVDTGFIVFNTLNYPLLTALFDHLGVATEDSDMSFSLSLDEGRYEWAGSDDWRQVFAQRRNLARPRFWSMLWGMKRFNALSAGDNGASHISGMSLGAWLDHHRFGEPFRDDYLVPMSAAIWSTPREAMLDFPADAFLAFFHNHRLNTMDRPRWRTVSGGARNYLQRLLAPLEDEGRVRLGTPVRSVRSTPSGPVLVTDQGEERFDEIVLASHSDQSLALLGEHGADERNTLLKAIAYRPNRVILHSDPSFMPKRRRAWASWNYSQSSAEGVAADVAVTYWMNRLQNIDPAHPLFVTLNPTREPDPATVHGEWSYDHPQFDRRAMTAQKQLDRIQGRDGIWLAGAWTGYGFHEDGLRAGLKVAAALGATLPFPARLQPIARDEFERGPAPLEAAE